MTIFKMRKSVLCVACACGLGVAVGTFYPASIVNAASITNLDAVQHTITIVTGEKTTSVTIEPNQKLDGLCLTSCVVGLSEGDEQYEVAANDQITIESGELHFQSDEETSDDGTTEDGGDSEPVGEPGTEDDSSE